ncbi:MAG TPA: TOBE domain-containing protein, partial [Acidimicrobiales bacterium]
VVLVTHDPIDAHALADRVVVIEGGRVVQQGGLGEVTAHPRSRYVADLVGTNLVHGELDGHVLTTAAGGAVVVGAEADDGVVGEQYHGPAFAAIRPQAVAVHRRPPEGSPRNAWACTITGIDRHGDRVRLALDGAVPLVAEITAPALVALGLQVGDSVWAAVKAAEVVAYPE